MTPDRQQLVQSSWRTLEPTGSRLVELAVLHLVSIAPSVRPLLDGATLPVVCQQIADTIGRLIDSIDEPKVFVTLAIRLGRENPDRGLTGKLYPAIGEALIFALHLQLGDRLTPELQTAWLEAYRLASAIMQRGELSTTGEFARYRTGEYAAYQSGLAKET
jgi:hemoglobin-like flavoprotein